MWSTAPCGMRRERSTFSATPRTAPSTIFRRCSGFPNFARVAKTINDEFEDLVQKSKTTSDSEDRIDYLKAANKKILEDAAVVPMFHAEQIAGYASNVKGFDLDGGGIFDIKNMDIIG